MEGLFIVVGVYAALVVVNIIWERFRCRQDERTLVTEVELFLEENTRLDM